MSEGMLRIGEFLGLDQSQDEMGLKDGYSPDLQNVACEGGLLRTVRGYEKVSTEPVPGGAHSLAALRSRERPRLLAANRQGVYSLTEDRRWRLECEQPGMERISHLNYAKDGVDIVLLAGGYDPLCWDGENPMQVLEGAPSGIRHLALHYERVWAAGKAAEPDTVYWSRAYDPGDWSPHQTMPEAGGGFVLVPTFNGGKVRGLRNFFNDVVVFKDSDVFRIYGTYPGNYEIVRVHGIVGPIAERTIVPWADRVFFLSRDGLCAYNGVSAQPIDKGRARRFFDNVDYEQAMDTACAVVHKDVLRLALPEKGNEGNNAVLEVDLRRDIWTLRRDIRVDDFLPWQDELLFINDTGYLYALDKGEDYDGRPIRAYWQSKWMDFGRMGVRKRAGELRAFGSGQLAVTQQTEKGKHTRAMHFGQGESQRSALLRGVGNRLRLRIENQDGRPFALRGGLEWNMELDD